MNDPITQEYLERFEEIERDYQSVLQDARNARHEKVLALVKELVQKHPGWQPPGSRFGISPTYWHVVKSQSNESGH